MVAAMTPHKGEDPAGAVYAAIQELGDAVAQGIAKAENVFVEPNFPSWLYRTGGHLDWLLSARKNGARAKLKATPHGKS